MRFLRSLSVSHRRLLLWLIPLLGFAGFFSGYTSGGLISIHIAKTRLQDYAVRLIERSDAASQEARMALAAMESIHLPYCSHQQLDQYGLLLFRSRYLRDIGRMSNGHIDCSSLLGPLDPPVAVPAPSFAEPDQIQVYPDIPLFQGSGMRSITLRRGQGYVTLNPNLMASIEMPGYSYVFSVTLAIDSTSPRQATAVSQLPVWAVSEEGQGRFHQILFATRCSSINSDCVTAYASIPAVIQSERRMSLESAAAGAIAGTGLAVLFTLLLERRRGLEHRFRRMLQQCGLKVAYQPIVDFKTGRVVKAEALARWTDEKNEEIAPAVFLPLANQLGLAEQVTRCVVRTVLDDLREMLSLDPGFRVSFNISAPELAGYWLVPFLQAESGARGIPLTSLAVEITEGSTADHAALVDGIRNLRRNGIHVYLDDFGTGYSSLAYLESLGVDAIKIDKAFTHAIGTAAVTSPILRQIVEMADGLSLQVIVEGVETEQQAAYLKAVKCNDLLCQGWYFGRPMHADALGERLLAEHTYEASTLPS